MSDTPTVGTEKVFNPYNNSGSSRYNYNKSVAWAQGDETRRFQTTGTTSANPYSPDHHTPEKREAWQEGYEGKGLTTDIFDAPKPGGEDGIYIFPLVVNLPKYVLDGIVTRQESPAIVWSYDSYQDKQDPKVFPPWAALPAEHRCVPITNAAAWSSSLDFQRLASVRDGQYVELPCPPYDFEVDGNQLVITSKHYRKSGTKREWESVLRTMQEEVDEMSDGTHIKDDAVTVELTVRYDTTVSLLVTDLLDGDDMLDGDMWTGDEEDYHHAIEEAVQEYLDYEEIIEPDTLYFRKAIVDNTSYYDLTSF